MVERSCRATTYRLLVIGDKLVAAAPREPPQVVGDGSTPCASWSTRSTPTRAAGGHATSLTKIRLDDIARRPPGNAGPDAESVPPKRPARHPAQQRQPVHRRHRHRRDRRRTPRSPRRAVAAPDGGPRHLRRRRGLRDDRAPLEAATRRRRRVNAAPGLRMHLAPSYGKPARWARPSSHVQPGGDGRIPVVAVTGTNGKTTTVTRLIAHLFAAAGLKRRHDQHRRRYVNGRQIDSGDCSGPKSARNVLLHPTWTPPCSRPRAAASCAKAWASTAARWRWSPTSARATTWA